MALIGRHFYKTFSKSFKSKLLQRFKTLNGLTPFEFICFQWTKSPDLFTLNPHPYTLGACTISVESSRNKDIKRYYCRKIEAIMDQIERILNLIEDKDLEKLGKSTEVDKCNTKLVGKIIFKGLMKLIVMGQKTSLRALEMVINRCVINKNDDKSTVTYSGLLKRLKVINPDYFKEVYIDLINKTEKLLPKKNIT